MSYYAWHLEGKNYRFQIEGLTGREVGKAKKQLAEDGFKIVAEGYDQSGLSFIVGQQEFGSKLDCLGFLTSVFEEVEIKWLKTTV